MEVLFLKKARIFLPRSVSGGNISISPGPDSGIDDPVQQVYDEVYQDDKDRENHEDRVENPVIPLHDGPDDELPQPRPVEDRLDQDGPAQQDVEIDPHDG